MCCSVCLNCCRLPIISSTPISRLLKKAHLLRCATPAYEKYASFLMIACKQVSETVRVLHLSIFEQPVSEDFCNILLEHFSK